MNELDVIYRRLVKLEDEVKRVKNNTAPTIPSYDKTNFPQDAVYGQIVKDINDHSMWLYGEDDTWHQVGTGTLPAYAIGSSPGGVAIPAGSSNVYASFTGGITFTTDSSIMSWGMIDNPNDVLTCHAFGTYVIFAAAQTNADDLVVGLISVSNEQFSHIPVVNSVLSNPLDAPAGYSTTQDYAINYGTGGIRYRFENSDSLDKSLFFANMSVIYLPTG